MEPVDNTPMINDALNLIGVADDLLAKLDTIEKDTPAKEQTYEMIETVIKAQSTAIRKLVEKQLEIYDVVNQLIEKHNL